MPGQLRCNGCRLWYDKKLRECPDCGYLPAKFNPRLYRAKLDNHLFSAAERQDKERKKVLDIKKRRARNG